MDNLIEYKDGASFLGSETKWYEKIESGKGTSYDVSFSLAHTLSISLNQRSFYYTLLYSILIGLFGLKRIRKRKTPYITAQTISLFLFQWIPLFLLPKSK